MRDQRKPPVQPSGRPEGAPSRDDAVEFSIESTTMRLKSIKLRRAESERKELEALQGKKPAADSLDMPLSSRPAGRVRHDDRGVAVWDWAVATGEFAALSQTAALRKLTISDLAIDEAKPAALKVEQSGRDKGGGFDPYNQRGSGQRQGEAAQRQGLTGSANKPTAADKDRSTVLDQLLGKKK